MSTQAPEDASATTGTAKKAAKKATKKPDYNPTSDRPRYRVDREAGRITRDIGAGEEPVARYEEHTGVVELFPGNEEMRNSITAVMRGKNGGYFTRFGRVGMEEEKPPADAPPKPKMAMRAGEKSKDRLIWHAKYLPRTFMEMWGVFQMQIRTGFESYEAIEKDPDTGDRKRVTKQRPIYQNVEGFDYSVPALLTGEQRLLARAQTLLTQKAAERSDRAEFDESMEE